MAWIESHTVLVRHRKTVATAIILNIKPVQMIGHLHALWHSVLEQAEDGDLSQWNDEFIALAAGWENEPLFFCKTIRGMGWIDPGNLVHDWITYVGKYLESKYRSSNHARLVEIWSKHGLDYGKAPGRQANPGWFKLRKLVLERDKYICHYCAEKDGFMEVDHVVPILAGGTDTLENLVACCRSCNKKKGSKPYESQTKAILQNPDPPLALPKKEKVKTFIPPNLAEVKAYCLERKNDVNADKFHAHYEANGWVQGRGKKIKDWKAAVRTWEKPRADFEPPKKRPAYLLVIEYRILKWDERRIMDYLLKEGYSEYETNEALGKKY